MGRHSAPRPSPRRLRRAEVAGLALVGLVALGVAAGVGAVDDEPVTDGAKVVAAGPPKPAVSADPTTTAAVAAEAGFTLPADNALTPELAGWLLRLSAAGVPVTLTNDTAVLDTARYLCRETWTTPAAVGEKWGLSATQAAAVAELLAESCPAEPAPPR